MLSLDSFQDGSLAPAASAVLQQQAALAAQGGSTTGASIYIKGMPEDADKLWLYEKFARWGGVLALSWRQPARHSLDAHKPAHSIAAAASPTQRLICLPPPASRPLSTRRFGGIASVRVLIDEQSGKCNGEQACGQRCSCMQHLEAQGSALLGSPLPTWLCAHVLARRPLPACPPALPLASPCVLLCAHAAPQASALSTT